MPNTSSSSSSMISSLHWSTDKLIRISILTSIMCGTLIGNMYILLEFFYRRHRCRTRLHLFIVHLAIGDLTICFCTMTSELFLLIYDQEWILGNLACKLTLYIQVVTIASTTFINVAMTYDRYEAVCYPFRACKSTSRIHRTIAFCWFCSFLVAIPQLFIFERILVKGSTTKYRCASTGYTTEWQRRVYFTTFTSYVLIIPVLCMTIWYIRIIRIVGTSKKIWTQNLRGQTSTLTSTLLTFPTKVKTIKLALTIIVVFVLCWTPYMVLTLIEIYSHGYFRIPSWLDGVLQMISLLQSSLNPLIYTIFNRGPKYSPTLILAAASTHPQTFERRRRKHQRRQRDGSVLFESVAETSFKKKMSQLYEKTSAENL